MARKLLAIFEVQAVLTAEVPLHVGNRDDQLSQDAPVAVNGKGEPYLPGTSLAGPMRTWWRDAFGADPEEQSTIWGRIEKRDDGNSSQGTKEPGFASLLSVEDAPAQLAGGPTELRDGVGIDRLTGAAAENIKFDREVLPAGTTFGLSLRLEVPAPATADVLPTLTREIAEQRLAALLLALENGDIRFGGGKTRGLGRLTASDFTIVCHDVNTATGILARLKEKGEATRKDEATKKDQAKKWGTFKQGAQRFLGGRVVLLVHWSASTPVLNKAGIEGLTVDALPLVSGGRGETGKLLNPVLTGASIKGALRAQAERICRTMAKAYDCPGDDFLTQISLAEIRVPLVEALFGGPGRAAKKQGEDGKPSLSKEQPSRVGLGALGVDDCIVGKPLSPDRWRRILDATSAESDEAVRIAQNVIDADWTGARLSQHVAIDRWTGAAAENLLFNRLEPPTPNGGVFRLTLDTRRIVSDEQDENITGAALVLLMFVLQDLARERIPVGFGSTRGFGSIKLDKVIVESAGAEAKGLGFGFVEITADQLIGRARNVLDGFKIADAHWQEYWNSYPQTHDRTVGAA
jgi:CRISPR/Cas system CSM-associated protein Csm3 (group 7 of RAMP superfamily)